MAQMKYSCLGGFMKIYREYFTWRERESKYTSGKQIPLLGSHVNSTVCSGGWGLRWKFNGRAIRPDNFNACAIHTERERERSVRRHYIFPLLLPILWTCFQLWTNHYHSKRMQMHLYRIMMGIRPCSLSLSRNILRDAGSIVVDVILLLSRTIERERERAKYSRI